MQSRGSADGSIHGVDFTSAPRKGKPITVASGNLRRSTFALDKIEEFASWSDFEAWLRRPGPWIAGFDFPFGLPREAVIDMGWPQTWPALVRHCRALGRERFRAALDAHREARPVGNRYAHRAADYPAGSHSPLKLVNPPVGLMFLEGAPRLLDAEVSIPGMLAGDPQRMALEAYPGFAARQLVKGSYKSDSKAKQTSERTAARKKLLANLVGGTDLFGFRLEGAKALLNSLVRDATGDRIDAVLCAMQAAWAWKRGKKNYGLPVDVDPIEGWIAMVPEK